MPQAVMASIVSLAWLVLAVAVMAFLFILRRWAPLRRFFIAVGAVTFMAFFIAVGAVIAFVAFMAFFMAIGVAFAAFAAFMLLIAFA